MNLITFSRLNTDINVKYKAELKNEGDLNEQFSLSLIPGTTDSYLEKKLFYHFDKKRWTLNELIFFAMNNNLCIVIRGEEGDFKVNYGVCGGMPIDLGDFNDDFNSDYSI